MGRTAKDGIYLPKGREYWYCRFTDANGKKARISTGEKNELKAQQVCLNMMNQANSGELSLESESITVSQVLDLYFNGHGDGTLSKGYVYAKKHLISFFKNRKWRDICKKNGKLVHEYINRRSLKVKPATINKELGLLSAAANYVNSVEGITIKNPTIGKKQKVKRIQFIWLTIEQAELLIEKAKTIEKAPYLIDFIIISLGTAMRLGEVLKLEKSFIDFNRGYIFIPSTKSDQPHEVPISDDVGEALKRRINASNKKVKWLFAHADGERIKSVRRGFNSACKKAGIPITDKKKGIQGFRIHDQRHTVSSWILSGGGSIEDVQDLLNHGSIKTTETFYKHLIPEKRLKTVKSLPKLKNK